MSQYILAIDQGTTGSTAILINEKGEWLASKDQDFAQIYPQPAWVEHDPEVIWASIKSTIEELLREVKIDPKLIKAIGITNQRETVVAWSRKNHSCLYNALVWQCRRTTDFCEQLKKQKKQKIIQNKTGLVIDPYFSASKIRWLLKNVSKVRQALKEKDLAIGTIDSFVLWRLTNGESHKTDVSNASRTQLFNIKTLVWDKELLKIFSVPEKILPEVVPSSGIFGYTNGLGFLPDGIPISGIAGDQQAALFGQACFNSGEAKCTFGTGSFMLLNTGEKMVFSKKGMLTTIAWQIKGEKVKYAIEGGAFVCGASVQWLRDGLGIIKNTSEIEKLAGSVKSTNGVEFVPTLTGMGAPYWRAEARGLICGITRGTTSAHIARASLEAMALQNAEILLAMQKDLGRKIKMLKVDGGATINNLLMQIQADYLGAKVIRPKIIETTALGAALLAGLGAGIWKNQKELLTLWQVDQIFESQISKLTRKNRWRSWHKAIKKTLS